MPYSLPGESVELTFNIGVTDLVGTAGITVYDGQGATTIARTTSGIRELASTGIYVATVDLPADFELGQYQGVMDDGDGAFAVEDLTVIDSSSVVVVTDDFTYDLTTDVGKVRFEIGDTNPASPLFYDQEVQLKLDDAGGSILGAAASLCEIRARQLADDFDFATDEQSFKRSQAVDQWRKLAADLRDRAENRGGMSSRATQRADGYSIDKTTRGDGSPPASGRVRRGYWPPDRLPS